MIWIGLATTIVFSAGFVIGVAWASASLGRRLDATTVSQHDRL